MNGYDPRNSLDARKCEGDVIEFTPEPEQECGGTTVTEHVLPEPADPWRFDANRRR